jgi:hypothetical protein
MNILQAVKKIKHLDRKIAKTDARILKWCSHFDNEEAQYDMSKLIQSVNDLIEEKGKIRHALHRTNIAVMVSFQGKVMSIDELIILLKVTLPGKINTLKLLRRREKKYGDTSDIKIVMNYDPLERDKKIDALENLVDIAEEILDNINITTELT